MTRWLIPPALALALLFAAQPSARAADITGNYIQTNTGLPCQVQQIGNNVYLFRGSGGGQAVFRVWNPAGGVLTLERTDGSWPDNTIVTAGANNFGQRFLEIWAPGIGREFWRSFP